LGFREGATGAVEERKEGVLGASRGEEEKGSNGAV
jgi:hypothetical protein